MGRPWGRGRRVLLGAALLAALGAGGAAALAWRPAIPPIAPPPRSAFAPGAVARGAELAAVGDCAVCHTLPGEEGRPYAGGRALPTPFGTVYTTNITPDAETGIGRWPEAAFRRAMREGVARDGRHLYPALPYPHFTRATDEDLGALYAFLMTREPVRAVPPPNKLPFPLDVRATVAAWNLLYLRPGPWQPEPSRDARWNRGAYLVEGVGHCGACHTPRNLLGAERDRQALGGGLAEGWDAPPLGAGSPARRAWTEDELAAYLRSGIEAHHGAAAGPMRAVTEELAHVPEEDVRAIAAYIASRMPAMSGAAAPSPPDAGAPGATAFAGACAACHGEDAPAMRAGAIPSLALSTALGAPTPRNAIQVILGGIPWREGGAGPYMPGFGAVLTDRQMADLAAWLRARYGAGPPWTEVEAWVRRVRQEGGGA